MPCMAHQVSCNYMQFQAHSSGSWGSLMGHGMHLHCPPPPQSSSPNAPAPAPAVLLLCRRRRIGALHALPHPASQVFAIGPGYLNNAIVNINFAAPLQENQWGLRGEMNLMELSGALTGVKGAIRCALGAGKGAKST